MEAETNQELNTIRDENIDLLNENPDMFHFLHQGRKRINRIRREKNKSWKLQMN